MAIKKAAIYDPYLDTLGGGERYCLTVAEILLKNGYKVDIFWSGDKTLIEKAEKRFSLDLKDLNIVPDIFGIKPQNLNFEYNYGIASQNQLLKWVQQGYLQNTITLPTAQNTTVNYHDTSISL